MAAVSITNQLSVGGQEGGKGRNGLLSREREPKYRKIKAQKQEEGYMMARTHLSSHCVADVGEQHVVLQTQQQLRNSQLLLCTPSA